MDLYESREAIEFRKAVENYYNNGLNMPEECRIINKWDEDEHPRDENGRFTSKSGGSFSRPTLKLSKKEYGKVTHAINDVYKARYEGKSVGYISVGKNKYSFEIAEFNEYNIFGKEKNG